MLVSHTDLALIAGRASTLADRLGGVCVPSRHSDHLPEVEARLKSWRESISGDAEPELFSRRLAWDGLDLQTLGHALGSARLADSRLLPSWVDMLAKVMRAAPDFSDTLQQTRLFPPPPFIPERPIPFQEAFLPFLAIARGELTSRAGSAWALLSEPAHAALARSLIERLANISGRVLQFEFSIFRASRQPAWVRILLREHNTPEREVYQAFLQSLLSDCFRSLFLKYSVLARLLATAVEFWIEATAEFLHRLDRDLPLFRRTLQPNAEFGLVSKVWPDLSDLHHRGRSVIGLEFEGGVKLVYKPKNVGSEEQFNRLLGWLNDHGTPLPFRKLRVMSCSGYGWTEFIEQASCVGEEAAKRYYLRAGMLLCVLYVLRAVDCHCENLIAAGEHPMLIDAETLMHRRADLSAHAGFSEAHDLASEKINESVFRCGMLPRWQLSPDGRSAYDVSSLGAVVEQPAALVPQWNDINTDDMELRSEMGTMQLQANVPSLRGVKLLPQEYLADILSGFEQMYETFCRNRRALLSPGSPILSLCQQKIRTLFRQTDSYYTILRRALEPDSLQDGAEHSLHLDVLSRGWLDHPSKKIFWPIFKAEIEALEQCDIPHFTSEANNDSQPLAGDGHTIHHCFRGTSAAQVTQGLLKLNQADLEAQLDFIRASFGQREMDQIGSCLIVRARDHNSPPPLDSQTALQEALRIAVNLKNHAIRASDGSATWIGYRYLAGSRRYHLQPLGFALYDGSCGAALFLAALERVTGGAGYRDLALGALLPLRLALSDVERPQARQLLQEMSNGGVAGLGSIIYVLARASELLREPELIDDARKLCGLMLTQARLRWRSDFGILEGTAGALLGVLSLYQVTSDQRLLAQASACGLHLVESRGESASGFRAWPSSDGRPLTGFSHGAAGIAYALLRLYEARRDPRFLQAAEEGISYERSVFAPKERNWPDFRVEGTESYMTTWCHGAPGIGLGRLGALHILDTPEIRAEIDVALETTLNSGVQNRDHLCCGNFGTAEVLLEGGLLLNRPELLCAARERAALILETARQNGYFRVFYTLPNDIHNAGFFAGSTGIGYALLRLGFPHMLPSVLRLE